MITVEELFQKLENQYAKKLPFVAYRKPGKSGMVRSMFQKNSKLFETGNLRNSGFIFAPFDGTQKQYFIPVSESEYFECEDRVKPEIDETRNSKSETETESDIDFKIKEQHINLVNKGIEEIKKGTFRKVVLSRSEVVPAEGVNALNLFSRLLLKYPEAMVYIWFHPETGIWMGATPETLVETNRNRFKTMSLAGTQKFEGDMDVNWGAKEIEEQQLVTDYISNAINNSGVISDISVSEAYTKRAGGLLHICTDITGRLISPGDLDTLVATLHPTPAVCGLPKNKAFDFIRKEENHDREFYSGYLGELNLKNEIKRSGNRRNQENQQFAAISLASHLFVNLRCMKLSDTKAKIFIGGGITRDSIPEDEWWETVNKSQTMKSVLGK